MVNNYILDTNILIQTHGQVIFGLQDNNVVIVDVTLEELDRLKSVPGETGYAARECIRKLPKTPADGGESYGDGISLPSGGRFYIIPSDTEFLPMSFNKTLNDNLIIGGALLFAKDYAFSSGGVGMELLPRKHEDGTLDPVILITNDISMKVKAQFAGLKVQDYRNDRVSDAETYKGRRRVDMTYEEYQSLIFKAGYDPETSFVPVEELAPDIEPNEFIEVYTGNPLPAATGWNRGGKFMLVNTDGEFNVYGVYPKNTGQGLALKALAAPADDIPLVILKGPAGCGKTLLACAAALQGFFRKRRSYERIIISRSNTLSDEEMGFLPGDIREKMGPLLSPFYDNLTFLLRQNGADREEAMAQVDDMVATGSLEIQSLAYIRGRSIPDAYIIIDEAQNLTIPQAKTIITRCGENSKIVLMGDPDQIDNPKVDRYNNGLAYISEKMKGSALCAQVEFRPDECVRSKLAMETLARLG